MSAILMIGKSHTNCVRVAASMAHDENVRVINLNRDPELRLKDLAQKYSSRKPLLLALSFNGNLHNVLCLGEHPIRYSIGGIQCEDAGRQSIPHALFLDFLRAKITAPLREFIKKHEQAFAHARTALVSPPPPLSELDKVDSFPPVLTEKIENGFTPPEIRLEAYRCQQTIYREVAEEVGVAYIEPPVAALSLNGLLKSDYSSQDPTHANAAYGELVILQLKEHLNAEFF